MFRLACDVGGTFTDVIARSADNRLAFAKVATTPEDPVTGVLAGIDRLAEQLGQDAGGLLAASAGFVHGTTIATNVLAEGRLARVAMLTTRGFRDVLELRDGTRRDRYRLRVPFPAPLIPRELRFEVAERMGFDGKAIVPLDVEDTRLVIRRLLDCGVESVLIGLLHSHRNPAHELQIAGLLREAGWAGPIVQSHLVLPQEGEYVRFSTAAIEAGVAPSLQSYLDRLRKQLEQKAGRTLPISIMQSSGGILPIAGAAGRAVWFVNSGPAGGAVAAAGVARRLGSDIVAFDLGGTTTDISIIRDGRPLERLVTKTDAYMIGLPMIDINVLSLGGGSIARIGVDGMLQLGPQSAGAVPGPAAYGRGGMHATLTDAMVVLGLLSSDSQDSLPLSHSRAAAAITRDVATPLGLSLEAAAEAVFALAVTIIAGGVRAATIGQGIDPRGLALMGFGGGGGLMLAAVAREIGARIAVAPATASVLSAAGFLDAEMRLDTMRPLGFAAADIPGTYLATTAAEMVAEIDPLRRSLADDVRPVRFSWIAECRYTRQIGTIPVPVDADELDAGKLEQIVSRFEARYLTLFGHVHRGENCVIDALRLTVTQPGAAVKGTDARSPDTRQPVRGKTQRVYQNGKWSDWPVLSGSDLPEGAVVHGPLLCRIGGSVVIVQADDELTVDDQRMLRLEQQRTAA